MSNLDLKCFLKNQIYFHKFYIRKLKLIKHKKDSKLQFSFKCISVRLFGLFEAQNVHK